MTRRPRSKQLLQPTELLNQVVRQMVDLPELVRIEGHESDHTASYDIHVADSDVGKVLGRKGSHAHALRLVFGAIYGKHGKRLNLQVVDPTRR